MPPADLAMRVAKRIAYLRAASGITQEELAKRLEIALKNLQRIESGRQNLTLASVDRIAQALRVEVRELFASATAREPGQRASATSRKLDGLAGAGRQVLHVRDETRPAHSVPVTSLRGAASRLAAGRGVEAVGWLAFTRSRPPEGAFVARVLGTSMEPTLPDGSWVLFVPLRGGLVVGRVVLVDRDAEGSGKPGFLLKRVAKIETTRAGKQRVVLRSDNAAFPPISVDVESLADLRVVSEVWRVLK